MCGAFCWPDQICFLSFHFFMFIYITQIILNTCYESNSPNSPSAYRIVSQGYSQPLPLGLALSYLLTLSLLSHTLEENKQEDMHSMPELCWALLQVFTAFEQCLRDGRRLGGEEKRHLALNGIPFSDKCSILALYLTAAKKSHSLFSELVS